MLNTIILVFVGGAVGAVVREFLMLGVPNLSGDFPLSIFVANIAASFLLGLATGLHQRRALSDDVHTLVGTGVMGGLSTFSSFVFGAYAMMSASRSGAAVALAYLLASLVVGYMAVWLGVRAGRGAAPRVTSRK